MAEADSASNGQCRAKTSDGDRCQRAAGEDGFCHQHGPDDETVDEVEGTADETEGAASDQDGEVSADGGESKDENDDDAESTANGSVGIVEVRNTVEEDVPKLIGHPFDGVVEIQRDDDGWYAVVEVVERSAVPDTQDIIGRYGVDLDGSAAVESYRLIERFKRGDVTSSLE